MERRNTIQTFVILASILTGTPPVSSTVRAGGQLIDGQDKAVSGTKVQVTATPGAKASGVTPLFIVAQEKTAVATGDKAYPPQLSGTVVDTSGAAIAGATVQVRSANGTVQRTTQSDRNGSFTISGLPAGNYRLVVSNPDFETKEIPVTIGATEASGPAAHLSGCERREHHHKRARPGG